MRCPGIRVIENVFNTVSSEPFETKSSSTGRDTIGQSGFGKMDVCGRKRHLPLHRIG